MKKAMTSEKGLGISKYDEDYLTIKNYKEPLKAIPKSEGYGYWGTLECSIDGKYVRCHICGKLYKNLSFHIYHKHGIKSKDYKKRFKLALSTALISEETRLAAKKRTLDWLHSLTPDEKEAIKNKYRESRRKLFEKRKKENFKQIQPKISLETKNKRGTCPDQLLDKIKQYVKEKGEIPSKKSFIDWCGTQRYVHLIYKTFGSWKKALGMLGYQPKSTAHSHNGRYKHYSREELLEYLRIYAQENNKIPTYTDFRRGLLPGYEAYIRRWGTIEEARQEAGVYDFVDNDENIKQFLWKTKNTRQEL